MNQEGMLKPALIGGVLLGVLSALPVVGAVNCLCCAWVIAGGVVAANLYVKSAPVAVTLGTGALLGLVTGAIGAIVDTVFSIPLHIAMAGAGMGVAQQVRQAAEQLPMTPETRDALLGIVSAGGGTGIFFMILSGIFKLVLYSLIATIGGALGVAIFEKRKPGVPPVPPYTPPPPPPPPPPTGPVSL